MLTTRLLNALEKCQRYDLPSSKSRKFFVPFILGGYPSIDFSVECLLNLQKSGADIIELGVHDVDSICDGPTILKAASVVSQHRVSPFDCLELVAAARRKGLTVPVLLMTGSNSILQSSPEAYLKKAAESGVDGLIIVNVPLELLLTPFGGRTEKSLADIARREGLSLVPMLALSSSDERIAEAAKFASSIIYLTSFSGRTGFLTIEKWKESVKSDRMNYTIERLRHHLKGNEKVKICLGFGIRCPSQVEVVANDVDVDGFVVGSALIEQIEMGKTDEGRLNNVSSLSKRFIDAIEIEAAKKGAVKTPEQCTPADTPCISEAKKQQQIEEMSLVSSQKTKCWFVGHFGGRYIPEMLMTAHIQLDEAWEKAKKDPSFLNQLAYYRRNFVNGPTPINFAERLTKRLGGAQIWLKREELAFTGAHKINNAVGQCLLAMKMGKAEVVAETGAGQHGVATATACAKFGLKCKVFMGKKDIERQKLNVLRMRLLGAEVVSVDSGQQTLKEAITEALRYWILESEKCHYCLGSVVGPHPFPMIVEEFQSVVGKEARQQMLNEGEFSEGKIGPGKLPDVVVACLGGGSNAIGLFAGFLQDENVKLIGVEGGGELGVPKNPAPASSDGAFCNGNAKSSNSGAAEGGHHQHSNGDARLHSDSHPGHSAALSDAGRRAIFHGCLSMYLTNGNGEICNSDCISAGLSYPGTGPHHAYLKESGRASYTVATDKEALDAVRLCCRFEGIIPALEPAHALAEAFKIAPTMRKDQIILVNLCGRGDKDVNIFSANMNLEEIDDAATTDRNAAE